jgi:hypothetical protein
MASCRGHFVISSFFNTKEVNVEISGSKDIDSAYFRCVGRTYSLIDISISKNISIYTFYAGVKKSRIPGRRPY